MPVECEIETTYQVGILCILIQMYNVNVFLTISIQKNLYTNSLFTIIKLSL